MTEFKESALQASIAALAVPGVVIGYRWISAGDERALVAEERKAFANSVAKVQRASGAARTVARELMMRLGCEPQAIPKSASGAPIWPAGLVGSLAHDAQVAVAAMARRDDFASLGIDIEPAEPLDTDLLNLIATADERKRIAEDPLRGRGTLRDQGSGLQSGLSARRNVS